MTNNECKGLWLGLATVAITLVWLACMGAAKAVRWLAKRLSSR